MTPCLFQNYFMVPSNNSHFKAIFSNLRGESILSFFILCFFYLGDLLLLDYTLHNLDGIFYLDVTFSTWMRHFFLFCVMLPWSSISNVVFSTLMCYFLTWWHLCYVFYLDVPCSTSFYLDEALLYFDVAFSTLMTLFYLDQVRLLWIEIKVSLSKCFGFWLYVND